MNVRPLYGDQSVDEFFSTKHGFPKSVSHIANKLREVTETVTAAEYFEQFGDSTVIRVVDETNPTDVWLEIISTCLSVYANASTAYCCYVSDLPSASRTKLPSDMDRTLFDEYEDCDILIIVDDKSDEPVVKTGKDQSGILNALIHKRSCKPGTITLLVGDNWQKCRSFMSYHALLEIRRKLSNK